MILYRGTIRFWITASLLALLSACTTRPATSPAVSLPVPATPVKAAKAPLEAKASPAPLSDAAPSAAAVVDDKNLLAGEAVREFEQGKASWYGPRFNGRRTASGERYNMHELTAAHKTLPFGTVVRVRSLVSGKEVDVRVTDRGPFSRGRVIDLSRAAAEALGMLGLGVKDVLLLVPESTPTAAEVPLPSRKRSSAVKRVVGSQVR